MEAALQGDSRRVDWRGVGLFIALAFGLTWLLDSAFYLSGHGLRVPWAGALLAGQMFMPAVATGIVTHLRRPAAGVRRATGLRWGAAGTRWGWYYAAAWLGVPLLVIAALFVSAAFGLYHMDLADFSGYRALLDATPRAKAALDRLPIGALVGLQLLLIPLAPIINGLFTFGEEWGWRGYLLPALLPLGQWRALIATGAIWGLWHAPILLLGYNYPLHPTLGVGLFIVFCVLLGVLFGWTRLATGSIWPAVIGHAAFNGSAGMAVLLTQAGTKFDTAQATIFGWSGWLVLLAAISLLVATRRLPVRHAPDLELPASSGGLVEPGGTPGMARPAA